MNNHSILVVDDQPHIVRVLSRALQREGYDVAVAGDGQQALQHLSQRHFDVVMTDYQMPRMDGRELCQALRGERDKPHPYIILVTAVADDSLRSWVAAQCNIRYLEKPVSIRQLKVLLDEHFSGARH